MKPPDAPGLLMRQAAGVVTRTSVAEKFSLVLVRGYTINDIWVSAACESSNDDKSRPDVLFHPPSRDWKLSPMSERCRCNTRTMPGRRDHKTGRHSNDVAGTGLCTAKYNPSKTESNHFLQIGNRTELRGVHLDTTTIKSRSTKAKRPGRDRRSRWLEISVQSPDARSNATNFGKEGQYADFVSSVVRHGVLQVARASLVVTNKPCEAVTQWPQSATDCTSGVANTTTDALLLTSLET